MNIKEFFHNYAGGTATIWVVLGFGAALCLPIFWIGTDNLVRPDLYCLAMVVYFAVAAVVIAVNQIMRVRLAAQMEQRFEIVLLLAKNEPDLFSKLYELEEKGSPVRSVLREVGRTQRMLLYSHYSARRQSGENNPIVTFQGMVEAHMLTRREVLSP
jgi:hypothetical protein